VIPRLSGESNGKGSLVVTKSGKNTNGSYANEGKDSRHSIVGHARIPPHSIEAEESVLGAVLLDNEAINLAIERLHSSDFYKTSHRVIFESMTELAEAREPIDMITLTQKLKENNRLVESGGAENIARLASLVPSAASLVYYARIVKEMSIRRKIIHEASELASDAFEVTRNIEEFLDSSEQRILGVADFKTRASFYRVGEVVQDSIKLVETLADQKKLVTGVPTGFSDLDKITSGLQKSDLIVLAARPSMGKTSLALNLAQNIGIHENLAVAVFSLEMSKEQLVLRMLCSEARVDNTRVRTGHLGETDFPRLVNAASKIAEAPIFIDDTAGISVGEMKAKARRLHKDHPLSLIVVDYLQLMRSPEYAHSREQEISDISRSLKGLAKELSVPVIALSQLNRSVESREKKRPQLSDLRESGAIEQDADIIMFIYRDEVYNPDSPDKGVSEVIIGKHRNGPVGSIRLAFFPELTRFDNLIERDDIGSSEDQFSTGSELDPLDGDLF